MRRQTTFKKTGEIAQNWRVIDAAGVPLGRLAAEVATVLQGKHRPDWTPHSESGDMVIVLNGQQVGLTGNKAEQRLKLRYTGYPGGLKAQSYGQVRQAKPDKLIGDAVRRMLPKNRMSRVMMGNLKVFAGKDHPFTDKNPTELKI